MGARSGKRIQGKMKVRIVGTQGPVAQLLHPLLISRSNPLTIGHTLQMVDESLSSSAPNVKLVVSGGGFMEIDYPRTYTYRVWRSEQALDELTGLVAKTMQPVVTMLATSERDYVIGVDVFGQQDMGNGQFAVFFQAGKIKTIAWKSYPVGHESDWLAGFGTQKGRHSPRIVSTALGKTMLLVCHDAQAFNHRNIALVNQAFGDTARGRAMTAMEQLIKTEHPEWALNLIHRIDKEASLQTFHTSYSQIHHDHHVPAVVGAFGYDPRIQTALERLSRRAQFPDGTARVVAILEVE